MYLFKTLLSRSSYSLLRPRNIAHKSYSPRLFLKKKPSRLVGAEKQSDPTKPRKPLDILFKEAVDIYPKRETGESDGEGENNEVKRGLRELEREIRSLRANSDHQRDAKEKEIEESKETKGLYAMFTNRVGSRKSPKDRGLKNRSEGEGENNEVKRGLKEREREVRSLRPSSGHQSDAKEKEIEESKGKKGLHAVFTNRVESSESPKDMGLRNPRVVKELSQDMRLFLSHLYKEGYLKDANFLPAKNSDDNGLDFSYFDNSYGIDFIKFAAQKYGKDNQEIAKWLSGSDLKNVALFGCPSLAKKSVFAAKRLRNFFEVQEDTVCTRCVLKQSCKFVNQNVWNVDNKKLILTDVLNVITPYALESVPPELVVPDDIKASVSKLLNEVVKLGQTTS
ncbi:uncharacterized protein LOC133794131 [Humulus lupulus]|uniref:uncharacterized protein LOC133794131 n=1 Tax=Humulus lupulus TaxID=3486 RepID=UPI002B40CA84|nr:uncharacterized protein LOC133794131 [Humulus lupulus]XP_062087315.1 uncharacterized protein LOC133794131 [Humulus lupulus]